MEPNHSRTHRGLRRVLLGALIGALATAGTAGAAAVIDGGDVKNGSLTGKDVKNRSLTPTDFRGSVRGPQGPAGPQGPPGPVVLGRMTTVRASLSVPAGAVESVTAVCPAGYGVVSGGWTTVGISVAFIDRSFDGASWTLGVDNFDSPVNADSEVFANCVPRGQAMIVGARDRDARVDAAVTARRAMH